MRSYIGALLLPYPKRANKNSGCIFINSVCRESDCWYVVWQRILGQDFVHLFIGKLRHQIPHKIDKVVLRSNILSNKYDAFIGIVLFF